MNPNSAFQHNASSRVRKRLIGSFYGSCQPRVDMPKLLNLYAEGKLKLDELITRHYRLEQINEAFADMEAGENARGRYRFQLIVRTKIYRIQRFAG